MILKTSIFFKYYLQFVKLRNKFMSSHEKNQTLASDVMSTNLIVIRAHQTYREAIELLIENRLTVLPVVSETGKFLGLLSEKEILKACQSFENIDPHFLECEIRFKKKFKTVKTSTHLDRVGFILSNKSIRHIPVLDDNGLLKGMITRRDLIRVLYLRVELDKSQEKQKYQKG
jgi:CBS domain-containing protein